MICENLGITSDGILTFGGKNTVEILKKYGSPLYLMDEVRLAATAAFMSTACKSISETMLFRCLQAKRILLSRYTALHTKRAWVRM